MSFKESIIIPLIIYQKCLPQMQQIDNPTQSKTLTENKNCSVSSESKLKMSPPIKKSLASINTPKGIPRRSWTHF